MSGKTVEARVTHRFKASPERVFDAWLDPAIARKWMSLPFDGETADLRQLEIDARVGGRFTFSDMREDGEAVHWGTYLVIERPKRLVFTWFTSEEEEQEANSVVELTIERDGGGCIATMIHTMDAKWAEWIAQTQKGWGSMLDQIDQMLAQEPEVARQEGER